MRAVTRLAMCTYTPVTSWLELPLAEIDEWSVVVRSEIDAQQQK